MYFYLVVVRALHCLSLHALYVPLSSGIDVHRAILSVPRLIVIFLEMN